MWYLVLDFRNVSRLTVPRPANSPTESSPTDSSATNRSLATHFSDQTVARFGVSATLNCKQKKPN